MKISLANCLPSRLFFLAKVIVNQTRMPLPKWQTRFMPRIFSVQWSSTWASLILRYVVLVLLSLCLLIRGRAVEFSHTARLSHTDITPAICMLTGPQARKDVCNIYSILLRRQLGSRSPTVDTIATRPDIIFNTLKGCV